MLVAGDVAAVCRFSSSMKFYICTYSMINEMDQILGSSVVVIQHWNEGMGCSSGYYSETLRVKEILFRALLSSSRDVLQHCRDHGMNSTFRYYFGNLISCLFFLLRTGKKDLSQCHFSSFKTIK